MEQRRQEFNQVMAFMEKSSSQRHEEIIAMFQFQKKGKKNAEESLLRVIKFLLIIKYKKCLFLSCDFMFNTFTAAGSYKSQRRAYASAAGS